MQRRRSLRSLKSKPDLGLIWNKPRPPLISTIAFSKPANNCCLRVRYRAATTILHEQLHFRHRQLTILRNKSTKLLAKLEPAPRWSRQRGNSPPRRESTWVRRRSLAIPTLKRRSLAL